MTPGRPGSRGGEVGEGGPTELPPRLGPEGSQPSPSCKK